MDIDSRFIPFGVGEAGVFRREFRPALARSIFPDSSIGVSIPVDRRHATGNAVRTGPIEPPKADPAGPDLLLYTEPVLRLIRRAPLGGVFGMDLRLSSGVRRTDAGFCGNPGIETLRQSTDGHDVGTSIVSGEDGRGNGNSELNKRKQRHPGEYHQPKRSHSSSPYEQ
jgi:hypothetical protein